MLLLYGTVISGLLVTLTSCCSVPEGHKRQPPAERLLKADFVILGEFRSKRNQTRHGSVMVDILVETSVHCVLKGDASLFNSSIIIWEEFPFWKCVNNLVFYKPNKLAVMLLEQDHYYGGRFNFQSVNVQRAVLDPKDAVASHVNDSLCLELVPVATRGGSEEKCSRFQEFMNCSGAAKIGHCYWILLLMGVIYAAFKLL